MLSCFLAKHIPECPGLVNKVQPLKKPLTWTGLPAPGQAGGDPPPVMELLTQALRKTLLRLFTLMLFSSNISVIKEINGQEKRPVQSFDFLILMAYLFTPTSVPIGFSLRGLRCKWSSIDTSC